MSDLDLLLRMARGDQPAARELWARFGRRLTAYAAARLRCDAAHPAAADAVQAVFVRVLQLDARTLREIRDVGAWLAASVRYAALNAARSSQRAEGLRLRLARGEATDERDRRADEELRRALDRLGEDHREVVLLKHAAGLTLDQMALSLGEHRSTLASRYRVAMEQLREALDAEAARGESSPGVVITRTEVRP